MWRTQPPMPASSPTTSPARPLFDDRMTHLLVVGKTGTGKSTLLRSLAAEDLRLGRGLLLLDPHGDLAHEVHGLIPRFRKNDVVHFDPLSDQCPGLNPFHLPPGATPSLAVSGLLSTFEKLFVGGWGWRTEHVLRNVFMTLMGRRNASLKDAQRLLLDSRFRDRVLTKTTDAEILDFWLVEFSQYGRSLTPEVTAAPLNKLGSLLASPPLRALVTRARPKLELATVLARGQAVIANLAKGDLGEDGSRFVGGLLLGALYAAVLARGHLPLADRRPFMVTVDEAGSFAAGPLLALLQEARKFGVGLTLAVQSLSALPPEVRSAFLGNANTLVAFRVSGEDAELLAPELALELGPKTLTSLPVGRAVVRQGGRKPIVTDFTTSGAA